jgi:hypothetical protein
VIVKSGPADRGAQVVDALEAAGIQSVTIRSPLTCETADRHLRGLLRP